MLVEEPVHIAGLGLLDLVHRESVGGVIQRVTDFSGDRAQRDTADGTEREQTRRPEPAIPGPGSVCCRLFCCVSIYEPLLCHGLSSSVARNPEVSVRNPGPTASCARGCSGSRNAFTLREKLDEFGR